MATYDECSAALNTLAARLSAVDAAARRKHVPDRTVQLDLLDLDASFRGRLADGDLVDIEPGPCPKKPNIRLIMNSNDLVDLTEGRLHFAHGWATGRIRLDASLRDLLRLRALM